MPHIPPEIILHILEPIPRRQAEYNDTYGPRTAYYYLLPCALVCKSFKHVEIWSARRLRIFRETVTGPGPEAAWHAKHVLSVRLRMEGGDRVYTEEVFELLAVLPKCKSLRIDQGLSAEPSFFMGIPRRWPPNDSPLPQSLEQVQFTNLGTTVPPSYSLSQSLLGQVHSIHSGTALRYQGSWAAMCEIISILPASVSSVILMGSLRFPCRSVFPTQLSRLRLRQFIFNCPNVVLQPDQGAAEVLAWLQGSIGTLEVLSFNCWDSPLGLADALLLAMVSSLRSVTLRRGLAPDNISSSALKACRRLEHFNADVYPQPILESLPPTLRRLQLKQLTYPRPPTPSTPSWREPTPNVAIRKALVRTILRLPNLQSLYFDYCPPEGASSSKYPGVDEIIQICKQRGIDIEDSDSIAREKWLAYNMGLWE